MSATVSGGVRVFRAGVVAFDDPEDRRDLAPGGGGDPAAAADRVDHRRARRHVHRIFESLNNAGLKLSQADVLHNQSWPCDQH